MDSESLVAVLGELAQGERPLVMVTHHLEEIPPGFSHALLLRAGGVVAAGPISVTLSSAAVSDTFGVAVTVDSDGTRWSTRVDRTLTIRTLTGFASGNDGWLATRNAR